MSKAYIPQPNLIGMYWDSLQGTAEVVAHQILGSEEKIGIKYANKAFMDIIDRVDLDRVCELDGSNFANKADQAIFKKEEEEKRIKKFNLDHPKLEEFKIFLLKKGKSKLAAGKTYKALQKVISFNGDCVSRCKFIHILVKDNDCSIDKDKMRLYIDKDCTRFHDIDTKSELNFSEWLMRLL